MQTTSEAWEAVWLNRHQFGPAEFGALRDGRAACVVIDDFYPEAACRAITDNAVRLGLARSYTIDKTEASFSGLSAMEMANRKEEYLAGVWVWEAPDLDVALELATEASKICDRKIEVRPFQ